MPTMSSLPLSSSVSTSLLPWPRPGYGLGLRAGFSASNLSPCPSTRCCQSWLLELLSSHHFRSSEAICLSHEIQVLIASLAPEQPSSSLHRCAPPSVIHNFLFFRARIFTSCSTLLCVLLPPSETPSPPFLFKSPSPLEFSSPHCSGGGASVSPPGFCSVRSPMLHSACLAG